MKSMIKMVAFSAGFFAGGIVAGMFLSPKSGKENRASVREKSHEAGAWMNEKGQVVKERANKQVDKFKDSVPDLYKATENIDLKDDDLL